CDLNPFMICNPAEPAGNTNLNYPFSSSFKGKQILLLAGGGSAWAPGNFGWVDVSGTGGNSICASGGNKDTECEIALVDPLSQCVPTNMISITTVTGTGVGMYDALNTRFDMYPNNDQIGPVNNAHTNANFAPSVNVTKGVCNTSGGNCDYSTSQAKCP